VLIRFSYRYLKYTRLKDDCYKAGHQQAYVKPSHDVKRVFNLW
jgi:hypothetical protein